MIKEIALTSTSPSTVSIAGVVEQQVSNLVYITDAGIAIGSNLVVKNNGVLVTGTMTASASVINGNETVTGNLSLTGNATIGGTILSGTITSQGSVGGLYFYDRSGSANYSAWYRSADLTVLLDAATAANAFVISGTTVNIPITTASTSPTTGALHVSGGVGIEKTLIVGGSPWSTQGAAHFGTTTNGGWAVSALQSSSVSGGAILARIDSINCSLATFYFTSGTQVGSITTNGTTTAYNTTSDKRLKEDGKEFDGLAIITKIDLWDFAWKKTGKREHGVFAQDALEIYPEAVTHDSGEDHFLVDYSKYIVPTMRSVQQLNRRLSLLEAKICP